MMKWKHTEIVPQLLRFSHYVRYARVEAGPFCVNCVLCTLALSSRYTFTLDYYRFNWFNNKMLIFLTFSCLWFAQNEVIVFATEKYPFSFRLYIVNSIGNCVHFKQLLFWKKCRSISLSLFWIQSVSFERNHTERMKTAIYLLLCILYSLLLLSKF